MNRRMQNRLYVVVSEPFDVMYRKNGTGSWREVHDGSQHATRGEGERMEWRWRMEDDEIGRTGERSCRMRKIIV